MTDRATLKVFLVFAKALSASKTFDASGTFKLLQRISKEASVPMEGFMRQATDFSLAAAMHGEVHSTAVARYALQRVILEIEGRLGSRTT